MDSDFSASEQFQNSLVTRLEGGDHTMRLSQASISALRYTKSDRSSEFRWDDSMPGFGVRIYPTGRKSFVLKYRIHGRQRLMVLGSCNVLTLEEARNRAKRHFVQLLDKQDPLSIKHAKEIMFDEFAKEYVERHASLKRSGFEDARRIKNFLLPVWKNRTLKSITKADVSALHHKIGQKTTDGRGGRTTANRVRELIQKMFNCAEEWGYIDHTHKNPASGIREFPETERARFLSEEEIERLSEVIKNEPYIFLRAAIWLYLLTGLRKNELLRTPWADVDLKNRLLRIPGRRTKNGDPVFHQLSEAAAEILAALPRVDGNPFLFVSERKRGRHMVAITKAWHRIRAKAELQDVRIHDLRRTVGAWMAMSGQSTTVIGKVLNHASLQSVMIYARVHDASVRCALNEHGERMRRYIG